MISAYVPRNLRAQQTLLLADTRSTAAPVQAPPLSLHHLSRNREQAVSQGPNQQPVLSPLLQHTSFIERAARVRIPDGRACALHLRMEIAAQVAHDQVHQPSQ